MDSERLWRQFNITLREGTAILAEQENKCAICGRLLDANSPATVGDHRHEDGAFFGWLCFLCNRGLGLLGDDIKRLQAAIAYLQAPPAYRIIGKRFGTIGRKAGRVPRNRKQYFHRAGEGTPVDNTIYRCGCSDIGLRASKKCPVHKQPRI